MNIKNLVILLTVLFGGISSAFGSNPTFVQNHHYVETPDGIGRIIIPPAERNKDLDIVRVNFYDSNGQLSNQSYPVSDLKPFKLYGEQVFKGQLIVIDLSYAWSLAKVIWISQYGEKLEYNLIDSSITPDSQNESPWMLSEIDSDFNSRDAYINDLSLVKSIEIASQDCTGPNDEFCKDEQFFHTTRSELYGECRSLSVRYIFTGNYVVFSDQFSEHNTYAESAIEGKSTIHLVIEHQDLLSRWKDSGQTDEAIKAQADALYGKYLEQLDMDRNRGFRSLLNYFSGVISYTKYQFLSHGLEEFHSELKQECDYSGTKEILK